MGQTALFLKGKIKSLLRRLKRRIFKDQPRSFPIYSRDEKAQILKAFTDFEQYRFEADRTPFFIVGSVRSGTTILRDLLRQHPRLECPEETHFFRWADPFGTPRYRGYYNSRLHEEQRDLDGISGDVFFHDLEESLSREQLFYKYARRYLINTGNPEGRIFDKTPQNVYNLPMIAATYPTAKIIHIHRHPLNVVSSLLQGNTMPKQEIAGAINYWKEAITLINEFKKHYPERVLEIRYEELVKDPNTYCHEILAFVGEDPTLLPNTEKMTHPERNSYLKLMSPDELDIARAAVKELASLYNYRL